MWEGVSFARNLRQIRPKLIHLFAKLYGQIQDDNEKDKLNTKSYLQANATFVMPRVGSAFVFSLQTFVEAHVAYVAMEGSVSMDSAKVVL